MLVFDCIRNARYRKYVYVCVWTKGVATPLSQTGKQPSFDFGVDALLIVLREKDRSQCIDPQGRSYVSTRAAGNLRWPYFYDFAFGFPTYKFSIPLIPCFVLLLINCLSTRDVTLWKKISISLQFYKKYFWYTLIYTRSRFN